MNLLNELILFYKFWGGNNWLRVALFTSFLFPGTLILGYIIVNIILTIENSNAAVSFYDILSLFVPYEESFNIFCVFSFPSVSSKTGTLVTSYVLLSFGSML